MARTITAPSLGDRVLCWLLHDHVRSRNGDYRSRSCSTPGCGILSVRPLRIATWWHARHAGAR